MNDIFALKAADLPPVLSILSIMTGYCIYWFIAHSQKVKNYIFNTYSDQDDAWVAWIFFRKMTGAFWIGLVPAILAFTFLPYSLQDYGINFENLKQTILFILPVALSMIFLNFKVSNNKKNLDFYPEMRVEKWTTSKFCINAIGWLSYLFAYEFMCRGVLLFTCYHAFGFWPALAINLCFYVCTHIAKGLTETIGTYPYGIVLCFVTIFTGNIWFAFITHSVLALSNDVYAIYHSPERGFVGKKDFSKKQII